MPKSIRFAVDRETGLVYSRVGGQWAIPVLEYDGWNPADAPDYHLEKFGLYDVRPESLIRTSLIAVELKNRHREFWGLKPLKANPAADLRAERKAGEIARKINDAGAGYIPARL
jgi:hypothetical protein